MFPPKLPADPKEDDEDEPPSQQGRHQVRGGSKGRGRSAPPDDRFLQDTILQLLQVPLDQISL